jgi:acetyl-CoA synthetase (ADP-forming)
MRDEDVRRILTEDVANVILKEYGIPVPEGGLVKSEEEAVEMARGVGYPIILKLISPEIDRWVGGKTVLLDIDSDEGVREGYNKIMGVAKELKEEARITGVLVQEQLPQGREVLVGMSRAPELGPLVTFSLSGIFAKVLRDVSHRVAPISKKEALAMIGEVKAYDILSGAKGGRPSDIKAIADVIVKVSRLGMERGEILAADIGLFVYEKGAVAVDSRIVVDKTFISR